MYFHHHSRFAHGVLGAGGGSPVLILLWISTTHSFEERILRQDSSRTSTIHSFQHTLVQKENPWQDSLFIPDAQLHHTLYLVGTLGQGDPPGFYPPTFFTRHSLKTLGQRSINSHSFTHTLLLRLPGKRSINPRSLLDTRLQPRSLRLSGKRSINFHAHYSTLIYNHAR